MDNTFNSFLTDGAILVFPDPLIASQAYPVMLTRPEYHCAGCWVTDYASLMKRNIFLGLFSFLSWDSKAQPISAVKPFAKVIDQSCLDQQINEQSKAIQFDNFFKSRDNERDLLCNVMRVFNQNFSVDSFPGLSYHITELSVHDSVIGNLFTDFVRELKRV